MRRALAAVLAALAVGGGTWAALARPAEGETAVVVATRQLPVGAVLAAADVTTRRLPADAVPVAALSDPGKVVGRPAAAVLTEGEVLTAADVGTTSLLGGQPADHVAVWLPLPEPAVAEAVSAGDRVDAPSPVDGRPVVEDVLVLAVRDGSSRSGTVALVGGGPGPARTGGAWLALGPEQSTALAAARGADPAGGTLLVALRAAPDGR